MSEHAHIVRVTKYRPAPGQEQAAIAALERGVELTAEAEGCFGAQVCRQVEDEAVLATISRWRDGAAMDAFSADPRARELLEGSRDLFAGITAERFRSV